MVKGEPNVKGKNRKLVLNRNKHATSYGLTAVFKELDILKDKISEESIDNTCVIIRSITILENFFREISRWNIIEKQIVNENFVNVYESLIRNYIDEALLIISDEDNSDIIDKFLDKYSKQDDGKIKLKLDDLDHNLKKYFNLPPFGIKAAIISGSYSFQNINDITFEMKRCDIDPFCCPADRDQYQKILDERNLITHTLNESNMNVKEIVCFIEKIIHQVLKQITGMREKWQMLSMHGIDFEKGLALYQNKKYAKAVEILPKKGVMPHNQIESFICLGLSYIELNEHLQAEEFLKKALYGLYIFEHHCRAYDSTPESIGFLRIMYTQYIELEPAFKIIGLQNHARNCQKKMADLGTKYYWA